MSDWGAEWEEWDDLDHVEDVEDVERVYDDEDDCSVCGYDLQLGTGERDVAFICSGAIVCGDCKVIHDTSCTVCS